MKWQYAFLILLTIISWNSTSVAEQGRVVTIGSDPWCPFVCVKDKAKPGFMVEIAQKAMALSGYEVRYENINWARAKQMVRKGEIDGIVGTSKGSVKSTPYQFPNTHLGFSEICFFKRIGDDWLYQNPKSLDSRMLGWINDYGFSDNGLDAWIKENKDSPKVKAISGKEGLQQRMFDLLLLGRIDTFTEDRFVIQYQLKLAKLEGEVEVAGCIGTKEFVYVAFSNKIDDGALLANALDTGVKVLRENGQLDEILKKYGTSSELGW